MSCAYESLHMKRDNPQSLISLDTETGKNIGADTRGLSAPELKAAGHKPDPLLKIIRAKCIDCSGYELGEVRKCTATACELWPYRMGTNPFAKRQLSDEQKAAARERMIAARSKRQVAAE